MGNRFSNDVVMVTGASGLVGSACVAAFLDEGARVVALGHKHQRKGGGSLSGVAPAVFDSDRLLFRQTDLKSDSAIEEAFAATEDRFGPVTVLVNNAAVYGR